MNWIISIAVNKAIKRGVQAAVAYLIALNLSRYGVTIDAAQLTIAVMALLEFVRNWIKVKLNVKWL